MYEHNDYPIEECAATVTPLVLQGAKFYQKFTCAQCKSRQTMDTANKFFSEGKCEECGHVTNIKASGCNYMLVMPIRRK